MAGEGRRVTLGEVIDLLTGFPFKSAQFSNAPENIRLLRGDNVAQGRTRWEGVKRWPADDRSEFQNYELRLGDVVLAMDRPWIEAGLKYAVITNADCPSLLVQRVARLRALPGMDQRYLGYVIGSADFTNYVLGVQTGTAIPHISASQIKSYEFTLPPIQQQVATAELLSALDDKIELNRQMNETLTAMARAIFKSWFVDFDPIRARIEGRGTELAADAAALFPDGFDEEEVGQLPKGWTISSIGKEVDVVGGNTPSTTNASYWSGQFAFATPKDLSNLNAPLLLSTERHLTEAGVNRVSSGLLPPGTVLMSSRAPIGYVAISSIPVCVNQGFAAMICRRSIGPIYAYFWVQFSMEEIKGRASGSTFAEISKSTFREVKFIRPPDSLSKTFETLVAPLFDRISINLHSSRTLSQARDFLLPKLMSGEVCIRDAEKLVGKLGA